MILIAVLRAAQDWMVTGRKAQQDIFHWSQVCGMQVVSQAEAQGRIKVVALSEVQGKHFEEPTVLIAEAVGGMEDIPVQPCTA